MYDVICYLLLRKFCNKIQDARGPSKKKIDETSGKHFHKSDRFDFIAFQVALFRHCTNPIAVQSTANLYHVHKPNCCALLYYRMLPFRSPPPHPPPTSLSTYLENGFTFIISRKGGVHLVHNNFVYRSNLRRQGRDLNKIYWECIYNRSTKCRGRLKTVGDQLFVTNGTHTHTSLAYFALLASANCWRLT